MLNKGDKGSATIATDCLRLGCELVLLRNGSGAVATDCLRLACELVLLRTTGGRVSSTGRYRVCMYP